MFSIRTTVCLSASCCSAPVCLPSAAMAVRSPVPAARADEMVPPSPSFGRPSSLKGVFMDKPVLTIVQPDDAAIDYIGRWDSSKTARWYVRVARSIKGDYHLGSRGPSS